MILAICVGVGLVLWGVYCAWSEPKPKGMRFPNGIPRVETSKDDA